MKKSTSTKLLVGALGLFALSGALPAHADFYLHSWDDRHTMDHRLDVGANFKWFHSSSNYDSSGSTFTPTGLNSYQRFLLDLNADYGFSPKLSAYARMDWQMSKVDTTNAGAFSGSAYGLGDQTLGLNYRIYEHPHGLALDLQAQLDFPAYSNDFPITTVPASSTLGDGSTDLSFGGFATLPISERADNDIRVTAGAAYTYRTKSFTALLPWSVSAELRPKKEGILLNGGFFGERSLNTDSHANAAAIVDTSTGSLGTGGSYITNAIDPSLVTARAEVGYQTQDELRFTGYIAQTVWGKEAPNGLTLGLGFQTHFGGPQNGREENNPLYEGAHKYGRSNKGYVNYDIEAKVLRANDRFQLVKINKGADAGVSVGDIFDIFSTKPDGSQGPAVARGRVTSVKGNEAAIKIEEYFKEVWIDEGFIARRPIP
jgi:hypothetical protein